MRPSAIENGPVQISNQDTEPSFTVSHTEKASVRGQQEEELYCDYDVEPTLLFKHLSERRWADVANMCFAYPEEFRTWIVRYRISKDDKQRKVRWKLLPLHTALIFKCPNYIVDLMVGEYPDALKRCDDEGMLPLHRAFRQEAKNDETAMLLLRHYEKHFPKGLQTKDKKGKIAVEYGNSSICTEKLLDLYSKVMALIPKENSHHPTSNREEKIDVLTVEERNVNTSFTDKLVADAINNEEGKRDVSDIEERDVATSLEKTIEDVNDSVTDMIFCLPSLPDEVIKKEAKLVRPPESNLLDLCMDVISIQRDITKTCIGELQELLRGIREHLLWFDQDFAYKAGRLPTREEREPIRKTYEVYFIVKDLLKLKQQSKDEIANSGEILKRGSLSQSFSRRNTKKADSPLASLPSDRLTDAPEDVSKDVSKKMSRSLYGRSRGHTFKNTTKGSLPSDRSTDAPNDVSKDASKKISGSLLGRSYRLKNTTRSLLKKQLFFSRSNHHSSLQQENKTPDFKQKLLL